MANFFYNSLIVDRVKYFPAYFSCPVCVEKGTVHPPTYWVHASCPEHHLYIGSDATLYCEGCGKKQKVMNALYACPLDSEAKDYIVFFEEDEMIDVTGHPINVAEAMCFALPLGREWMIKFIKSL